MHAIFFATVREYTLTCFSLLNDVTDKMSIVTVSAHVQALDM